VTTKFDPVYFEELCKWIRNADNGWYNAESPALKHYCGNIKRFVAHMKWYEVKNKDDRYIYIWQQTESEEMYGHKFCKFYIADIFYPGCLNYGGNIPDEIIQQKINRMWNTLGEIDEPKPAPVSVPVLPKARRINSIQKGLFD
jgi:hypothetical protein